MTAWSRKLEEWTDWLNSLSWKEKHGYSSTSINAGLLKSIAEDRLEPVSGSVSWTTRRLMLLPRIRCGANVIRSALTDQTPMQVN